MATNSFLDSAAWTPGILSEYEVGRSVSAIEALLRTDKPVAEVGCREVDLNALEADLRGCLRLVSGAVEVKFWTRVSGPRIRFGFYRESWVLDALDFLEREELTEVDRAWISGLLFGYRSDAIQQFIARRIPTLARRDWNLSATGTGD